MFKDANECSHIQSRERIHVSGMHCHLHASSTSSSAFVNFTVQYCIEDSSAVYLFQAQDVQKPEEKQQHIAECVSWTP